MLKDQEPPAKARLHAFALISGTGWLIDFAIFNLLAAAGVPLFQGNLVSASVAISFVFMAGRRFIFRNARRRLGTAVMLYALWNAAAVLLASLAVAMIGRWLSSPAPLSLAQTALAAVGLHFDAAALVAPAAKIVITPFTMYLNFVAMGLIVERRLTLL